ncbi:PhoH family protein [Flammeovirgaceae bacterium SG7u.111]|nr:PhoH family protein [Flammeovirgaceae bacterium SG7u.132]WPO33760.1 PhoH family protein [Flammeovirgaceae bacterium SG7u.111]
MPRKKKAHPKIFVLDTSVILYDHASVTNFEENDIAIPISVLEELDHFKKGNDTLNFNAREFTRFMDGVSDKETLHEWVSLGKKGTGKIKVIMEEKSKPDACELFGANKADHRILNVAIGLSNKYSDRKVILVSKDINLRIKAKSLDLTAADYETGKIRDVSELYSGKLLVENATTDAVDTLYQAGTCESKDFPFVHPPEVNQYFIIKNTSSSALAYFNPDSKLIERVEKRNAYGIKPRNAEQVFALHALLNPAVKLVTLQGVAGTGKTLLALAAAVEQRTEFHQIFLARPIVPLSNKDIGFLPGDIKSKINPYMEPLYDNLKFIRNQFREGDKEYKRINEMLENDKLVITPLAYIRGRSLSNIFFIVDEAQNLTPHEVKTIISRAGENTKIVFTGDIYQIDTPYLDTQSNGLSYLIDRIHGHPLAAHVKLEKGERSELANLANELL